MSESVSTLCGPLREWRDSAMELQMYKSALFWAKKLVAMGGKWNLVTRGSIDDILHLAKIYYCEGEWARAERLLESDAVLGMVECRILAAQVAVKLEKWNKVLEILEGAVGTDPGIQIKALILYLRGVAYSHLNDSKMAKSCLIDSVQTDFRCFQAFEWMIKNNLLSVDEENELIESISFGKYCSKLEDFSRVLYLSQRRMSIWYPGDKETKKIITRYNLQNDPDIILSEANNSFIRTDYQEALTQTTKLLDLDPFSPSVLTLHISCLYALKDENKLFLLAHQLVDSHPNEAIPWYAIGTFYLLTKKHHEARRYFSKASSIDPQLGCAWIGFGHSFALEDESDQAIFAYSSASKIIKGSHVPFMFIGMQHLKVGNYMLSKEYLLLALEICNQDPLLLQELGILYYNTEMYEEAISKFQSALSVISSCQNSHLRETILFNLGHTHRKLKEYSEAANAFKEVMTINPLNAGVYAALGILSHLEQDVDKAIEYYHYALNLEPDNPRFVELLDSVLADLANLDPIKIVPPPPTIKSKCHALEKYFSDEVELVEDRYSARKSKITPQKETPISRKLAGVRTRSQTKNMASDPFTDPFSDNNCRVDPELFISSFKTRLFNQTQNSSSPAVPNRLDFLNSGSNRIDQSANSSFSFSPFGQSGQTPLFFPPAREPSSLHAFRRAVDSDEVEMEIDDV